MKKTPIHPVSGAIFGIGVDLCHIPRMERALPRIALRSFSPAELRRARATARAAEFLAGRWAAKEALLKALGTGISGFLPMKSITIGSARSGEPVIRLPRAAAARLRAIGAGRMHLSISHAGDYAMAAVIVERRAEDGERGVGG